MQENARVTRSTYKVPKGEEAYVHYTLEKVYYNPTTGKKESRQEIVKTNANMFEAVKRNLELQGNTINILYHPEGKYNDERVAMSAEDKMREEIEKEVREQLEAEFAKRAEEAKEKEVKPQVGRPSKK